MADFMITQCKDFLENQLRNASPFEKFESSKNELFDILENVIQNGDSDSVVIVDGTRSNSVPVITDILEDVKKLGKYTGQYITIHLDGLLQTDENIAFKVITECLGLNCTDAEVTGSLADRINYVMKCLEIADENEAKSIIFVINRFELFCTESQTLVYHLLDAAFAKKASICVVGVTRDASYIKKIGKRASSRYSGKVINLHCVNDVKKYTHIFRSVFSIETTQLEENFKKNWNKNIEELCSNKSMIDLLLKLELRNVNEERFREILLFTIYNLDEEPPHLTYDIFKNVVKTFLPGNISEKFSNFEMPEICVLVAIYHQLKIYGDSSFNFVMLDERLKKRKHRLKSCCLEKLRVEKAFQRIVDQFLSVSSEESFEYTMYKFDLAPECIKDFVTTNPDVPDDIKNWIIDPLC